MSAGAGVDPAPPILFASTVLKVSLAVLLPSVVGGNVSCCAYSAEQPVHLVISFAPHCFLKNAALFRTIADNMQL